MAARAGLPLEPIVCWLLLRIDRHPDWDAARLGREPSLGTERVARLIWGMAGDGLVDVISADGSLSDECLRLTPAGNQAVERLRDAHRRRLAELLEGWSPEQHAEIVQLVDFLTRELLDDEQAPRSREPLVAQEPG